MPAQECPRLDRSRCSTRGTTQTSWSLALWSSSISCMDTTPMDTARKDDSSKYPSTVLSSRHRRRAGWSRRSAFDPTNSSFTPVSSRNYQAVRSGWQPTIRAIGQWLLRCVPPPLAAAAQPVAAAVQERLGQFLTGCIERPRRLQILFLSIGLIVAAIRLMININSVGNQPPTPGNTTQPSGSSVRAIIAAPSTDGPLETIRAYNAASIVAGSTGKAEILKPFFVAGSPTWTVIEQEFKRRAGRLETHRATLSRWGIISQHTDGDRATFEMQEQWSNEIALGNVVIDARRGLLQRVTYQLERRGLSQPWHIKQIESTSIIN